MAAKQNKNLDDVFGCGVYLKDCKPANEFIALIVDRPATGQTPAMYFYADFMEKLLLPHAA